MQGQYILFIEGTVITDVEVRGKNKSYRIGLREGRALGVEGY